MGQKWGELAKIYNITTYRLSPHEQNIFKNFIKDGAPNLVRRFRGSMFIVGIPFLMAYCIKEWGDAEFARLQRKNPADFANDV